MASLVGKDVHTDRLPTTDDLSRALSVISHRPRGPHPGLHGEALAQIPNRWGYDLLFAVAGERLTNHTIGPPRLLGLAGMSVRRRVANRVVEV